MYIPFLLNMEIKSELQFYGFNDFFKKKEKIRTTYKTLTLDEIKLYKMYVYSTCFESEYCRDLMWEYLNASDEDFIYLSNLCKEWGIRQRRKRK